MRCNRYIDIIKLACQKTRAKFLSLGAVIDAFFSNSERNLGKLSKLINAKHWECSLTPGLHKGWYGSHLLISGAVNFTCWAMVANFPGTLMLN